MPRSHHPYPAEFRADAVRLVRNGTPLSRVARDLGIAGETLRHWVNSRTSTRAVATTGSPPRNARSCASCAGREPRAPRGAGDLGKSQRLLRHGDRTDPVAGFEFVRREKVQHPVATLCRVLGVSPSGFWAWQERAPSAHALEDERLGTLIAEIHRDSRETYGVPRVHAELRDRGVRCSRKRIARLMRQRRLAGVHRRRFTVTAKRAAGVAPAADLVARNFTATAPNQTWVADITYVHTWAGFLYPSSRSRRADCGQAGVGAVVRGQFPAVLLWFSASAECAPGVGTHPSGD